jgi:phosphohistidine phosphatase
MRRLLFLRHGIAQDIAPSDHARELTPEGIAKLTKTATVMTRLNLGVTHILSSPRVRAVQTAEIAGKALGVSVTVRDELNFSFSIKALPILLASVPAQANVLFVGHEPTFSQTIEALTGAHVVMKKGGFARVDIAQIKPNGGILVSLIPPKVFDSLA